METGAGVALWTILLLLLTAASDLNGDSTASPPSLTLNNVISTASHLTPKTDIVEVQSGPAHTETLHPAETTLPPSSELNTQTASRMDTSPPPASTHTPGLGLEREATQASADTSPPLISVRSTAVTPGSMITLSAAASTTSTASASETIPTTSSGASSRPASTLTALIDRIQPSGPVPLENPHQDGPSELDVGDEDSSKVPHASPWDPLLAALVSIFIVSTALVSIMLFLRFRQQSEHPEFHRLQDLPMDDLLEDTPLSRYSY
ncbi:platelet glycoprotein Ib alpha chain-like [Astyanax mexicanus]|uniref:Platelet glycoprotein Ib alpha chain-like n=1 Tax=Astyanax mexicanus TaxID=7994 RepID=A0A8T2LPV4_ASTMX|nr:platelet glycoprotein Ib alpha chain-like [Astyanax mexicanus]